MKQKKPNILKAFLYIFLTCYALITLLPFVWALSASFKPLNEILSAGLNVFPESFTFDNYVTIFTEQALFPRWMLNSVIVAVIGTALNVVFNAMAGYALARVKFPGRSTWFVIILAVLMIPAQVTMIPNFLILNELGWLNSYQGLIVPGMVNATFIFMMRQFFVNFPKEVEEAAAIDGLSRIGTFFRIVMPMAKPSLGAMAIFVFMGFWNNFMAPLIIMTDASMYTLPVGLNAFQSDYATYWNYIMAASMVFTLPVLILYIFFNKYFLKGLALGGDK